MKRKRSPTPPATRSVQTSHKESRLLQLPRELRVQILQCLLYSPEPLGKKSKKTFTFCPAILRACRQIYHEGYEVLYRQNTASASITLWYNDEYSIINLLGGRYLRCLGVAVAQRFIKWDVTVKLNIEIPKDVPSTIFRFISDTLCVIPDLEDLKVRLEIWDNEELHDPESHITFADPRDFEDVAEQIFRPFSIIRVRQAEFIDKQGYPIRTTLSLSRLMMSDIPPPITLDSLFNDLDLFLDNSLSEQSRRVVKARLAPLEIACDQYDVDFFRSALRSFLNYLSSSRGLAPPQHLTEFAKDSASTATGTGKISD